MSAMDGIGGAAKGAGLGAKLGSVVPGVGNVVGGLVGGIGGLLGGIFGGRSRAKAARLAAENAAKMARIDTEYSPFVGQKGYRAEPEQQTPGGALSGIAGAASGAMQGMNIYRGLKKDAAQDELLKSLANQADEKNAYLALAKDAEMFPGGFKL